MPLSCNGLSSIRGELAQKNATQVEKQAEMPKAQIWRQGSLEEHQNATTVLQTILQDVQDDPRTAPNTQRWEIHVEGPPSQTSGLHTEIVR
mmetsp:Transcript_28154/g.68416  ORF Transcript_28154/g.68416 Transcript_28154/m.68416 type:complete len:91 (-) Transcript_28154:94-366(-)